MRILFLGATGFIGPHFVRAALERGHAVSVFDRGQSFAVLPGEVERLQGDRNGDLKSIMHRDWDAVVDLAAFTPEWVESLANGLTGQVGHYTFISTIVVYDLERAGLMPHEGSPVVENRGISVYPEKKALCEREAEKRFAGRTLILRPGYIVGPGDWQGFLAHWPARMELGGEIMVPHSPAAPIQVIDVRDLAAWALDSIALQRTGIYNVVGPAQRTSFVDFIEAAGEVCGMSATLQWIPAHWLGRQRDAQAWSRLLFWTDELWAYTHRMQANNQLALAQGLKLRPLRDTIADALAWYHTLTQAQQAKLLWSTDSPQQSAYWDSWQAFLVSEKAMLSRWRAEATDARA